MRVLVSLFIFCNSPAAKLTYCEFANVVPHAQCLRLVKKVSLWRGRLFLHSLPPLALCLALIANLDAASIPHRPQNGHDRKRLPLTPLRWHSAHVIVIYPRRRERVQCTIYYGSAQQIVRSNGFGVCTSFPQGLLGDGSRLRVRGLSVVLAVSCQRST